MPLNQARAMNNAQLLLTGFLVLNLVFLFPQLHSDTVIELDARDLPEGPLETWKNTGSIEGDFIAEVDVPEVTVIDGIKGVTLDGDNDWYVGPTAFDVSGDFSRSIEAWVYNPSADAEETIFAWGRRGGPQGSNMAFNHGSHSAFGAIGHWGAPDIGWNETLVESRWTHVAYVYNYDEQLVTVYTDGKEADSEGGFELPTWDVDTNNEELPFVVGNQNEGDGTRNNGLSGSLTIAWLQVHNVPLTAEEIMQSFDDLAGSFGLGDSDGDGLPSWFENTFGFLDPNNPDDAKADQDDDGLTNLEEFEGGTIIDNPDSDGDGLKDGAEIASNLNPLDADTDQDGLLDGKETNTDPTNPDSDDDGFVDGQEVFHGSDPGSDDEVPEFDKDVMLVDLNAANLTLGPLEVWKNDGAIGGIFVSESVAAEVKPVGGIKSVEFLGDSWYVGPPAPIFLTGTSSRSIDAWIYNPEIAHEETIFSWGRRGGPDGTNLSFNHGTHDAFGAVGHWGNDADVGWDPDFTDGDREEPGYEVEAAWTYVVYTYDWEFNETCVYTDGELTKCEAHEVEINTWARDTGDKSLPFVLGNQNEGAGGRTPGLSATMAIGAVRVYDTVLSPETISGIYEAEKDRYDSSKASIILGIALSADNQAVVLNWNASGNMTYTVEVSTDLAAWSDLASGLNEGSYTDSSAFDDATVRFYRVVGQ